MSATATAETPVDQIPAEQRQASGLAARLAAGRARGVGVLVEAATSPIRMPNVGSHVATVCSHPVTLISTSAMQPTITRARKEPAAVSAGRARVDAAVFRGAALKTAEKRRHAEAVAAKAART